MVPGVLEGTRHARRRLAGTDHDRAALGRRRQTIRELPFRARGGEGASNKARRMALSVELSPAGYRNEVSALFDETASALASASAGAARVQALGARNCGTTGTGRAGMVAPASFSSLCAKIPRSTKWGSSTASRNPGEPCSSNPPSRKPCANEASNAPRQALARAPACLADRERRSAICPRGRSPRKTAPRIFARARRPRASCRPRSHRAGSEGFPP